MKDGSVRLSSSTIYDIFKKPLRNIPKDYYDYLNIVF